MNSLKGKGCVNTLSIFSKRMSFTSKEKNVFWENKLFLKSVIYSSPISKLLSFQT